MHAVSPVNSSFASATSFASASSFTVPSVNSSWARVRSRRPRGASTSLSTLAPYPRLPCHTSSDCPEFCFCSGNEERELFDATNPNDYHMLGSCVCQGNTDWGDAQVFSSGYDRREEFDFEWDRLWSKHSKEQEQAAGEADSTASQMVASRESTDEPAPQSDPVSPTGEQGPVALALLAAGLSAATPLHAAAKATAVANATAAGSCRKDSICRAGGTRAPPRNWNATTALGPAWVARSLTALTRSNHTLLAPGTRPRTPPRPLPPLFSLHAALPSMPVAAEAQQTTCCYKGGLLPPPLDGIVANLLSWIGSALLVIVGMGYCYNCCVNRAYRYDVQSRPGWLGGPTPDDKRKMGLQCWWTHELKIKGQWKMCEDGLDDPPGCVAEPPQDGSNDERCIFNRCKTYLKGSPMHPEGGDVAKDGSARCSEKAEVLCREKEKCRTILLDAGVADEATDRDARALKYEETEGAPTKRRWTRSDVYDHWHDSDEELHYGIFTIKRKNPPMFYHSSHFARDQGK